MVVVVATIWPAPPVSEMDCVAFVLRLLSAIVAVPVMAVAPAGTKSIASEQLSPVARLDAAELPFSCGQVLVLSIVKPAEREGFWPDDGTVHDRGAFPIFVTTTDCVLDAPICPPGKLTADPETFTTRTALSATMYRLPALSSAMPVAPDDNCALVAGPPSPF